MIRPEAAAALLRWREAMIGGALALLGLRWGLGAFGVLSWLGWALLLAGAALVWIGIQRALFPAGGGGPGVVTVDEGRIEWMGPFTGGAVALSELEMLELDQSTRPPVWRLFVLGHPPLEVPLNAEGAEALFDAFATLPGLSTQKMLAQLRAGDRPSVVVWSKQRPRLH